MGSGSKKHLGRRREILGAPAAPCAAMDEDKDHGRGLPAAVDVEPLDLGRTVGDALGVTDAPARHRTFVDSTLDQLCAIGRVGGLVIGRVERRLVIVEKY